jgi:superfamily II DNA or RNA helicase
MATLRLGSQVFARGVRWEVREHVTHIDCQAVKLTPLDPRDATPRTLLLPFDRVVSLAAAEQPVVLSRGRWTRELLRRLASERSFGSLAAAASAAIDVLPFQLEPALAFCRHACTRILIADAVGLGKTIQAGLVLAELSIESSDLRALVLTPAGLREQWRGELRERFGLESLLCDTRWLQEKTRELPPDLNPWSLPGIHVVSFDLVKRPEVLRSLEDVTWDLVVVDEAHACTAATARLAGANAVASRARRVLLLTATPPDGDPLQMAVLRGVGSLGDGDALVEFRRRRDQVSLDAVPRRSVLMGVRLSAPERRMHRLLDRYTTRMWREANARDDQRARLAAIVLRKRALSSAWSLAASVQRRLELLASSDADADAPSQLWLPLLDEDVLDDETPDKVMAAAGLSDAAEERDLLSRIHDAAERAAARESKVRFLLRFLRRAREPVIVFTEYRDTLAHLERATTAGGDSVLVLHGGLSPRERDETQRRFNDSGGVLLATDAASEGLNLHHRCRTVVHFELPWTLSRLEQRTGRVDRLGQRRRVHEVLLVARHTAERFVLAPLARRAHLARRAGSGHSGLIEALTESAVGAAVFDGRAPAETTVTESLSPFELRAEATAEAERLAFVRRAGRDPQFRYGVLVCRARVSRPLPFLVAVRLEDLAGRVVHSSVVPLVLECRLAKRPRSHREWKALAQELATAHRGAWQPLVLATVADAVRSAAARHQTVLAALARRDVAIEHQSSTARVLVQAGLFDDRHALRLKRRRQVAAVLEDEAEGRTQARRDAASVTSSIRIVAIGGAVAT